MTSTRRRDPIWILQDSRLIRTGNTVVIIPFTSNVRRAALPTCVLVRKGGGGLSEDSVALCLQILALDKSSIGPRIGTLPPDVLAQIEETVILTLGLV